MLLANKTALITGAARGIGKQIALAFAKEGCNIAFTDLELNDQVVATRDEIAALGVKVAFYASNAADFEAAHRLHEDMGCICFENPDMGIYFINDPDGYWLEILPTREEK